MTKERAIAALQLLLVSANNDDRDGSELQAIAYATAIDIVRQIGVPSDDEYNGTHAYPDEN